MDYLATKIAEIKEIELIHWNIIKSEGPGLTSEEVANSIEYLTERIWTNNSLSLYSKEDIKAFYNDFKCNKKKE